MANAIASQKAAASSPRATLFAALLSFSLITLDAFMVNVALPHIRADFGSGVSGMLWVLNGYTLMFAALMLPAGVLADRMGASRAFTLGLVGFLVSAIICAVAPSVSVLIAGRFLLGSSAAMLLPSSMAMLRDAFPVPKERARAIAIWAMGGAGASASGPLIAGITLEYGWRWIFILYFPICLVIFWLLRLAPRSQPTRAIFHFPSQAAVCAGMLTLVFAMIRGGVDGFTDPFALGAFVLAVLSFAAFARMQASVDHPLIPKAIIHSRSAVAAIGVGLGFVVGFYGLIFLLSLYLQEQRGLTALETGIAFIPMTGTSIVFNLIAARAAERYGIRSVIIFGLGLVVLGLGALAGFASSVTIPQLTVLTIPIGIGGALAMPVATAWLVNSVPNAIVGTASGLLNTIRQAGNAMAIAVYGVLVTQSSTFDQGLRISLSIGAISILLAIGAVVWSRRD